MNSISPLMARFAEGPALVEPSQKARFDACLAAVVGHEKAAQMMSETASADENFWPDEDSWFSAYRPYNVVDGVLQIPVKGVLLHNFPYALFDWATGYEYIWQAFKRGCGDYATGAIRGIAFISDSPGGMVAGCFDAVDKMVALKERVGVPVAAFAHEAAYSAAYGVITVADPGQIYVSRTGGVGSIGVVTGHLDVSGAMEKAGLKFTYIVSDPSKVEGNPYEALSPEAKARIQVRIDELYGIFVAAVSRSRGLEESVIREDLKAYCYTATQAVSNGLADHIGSLEDAITAFAGHLDDLSNEGEDEMADANSAVDQAAIATAREEGRVTGHAEGKSEGMTLGATAERERISAILGSEEAKGRESQAMYFATKTSMSVEDATGALAAAPKVEPSKPAATKGSKPESFEQAMGRTGNPDLASENDDEGGDDQELAANPLIKANSIFESAGFAPRKG